MHPTPLVGPTFNINPRVTFPWFTNYIKDISPIRQAFIRMILTTPFATPPSGTTGWTWLHFLILTQIFAHQVAPTHGPRDSQQIPTLRQQLKQFRKEAMEDITNIVRAEQQHLWRASKTPSNVLQPWGIIQRMPSTCICPVLNRELSLDVLRMLVSIRKSLSRKQGIAFQRQQLHLSAYRIHLRQRPHWQQALNCSRRHLLPALSSHVFYSP